MHKQLKNAKISKVDIIAGIPSFNEQDNIAFVVEQIGKGLKKYCPDKKSLIVDCDNGSTDNTEEAFFSAKTNIPKLYLRTKKDEIGKGYAFRMLFKLAIKLKAKVVIVDDADLKSITPEWVKRQIQPIFDGYDYVAPYYNRYKYDATITNNFCYPIIYGLFCQNIRQPIGGDFAFNGKLADYYLNKCKWTVNTPRYGIDIFLSINAILGHFKICQANLGVKIHKPKDPGITLEPMFRQVISTLFKVVCEDKNRLIKFKAIKKVPLLNKIKERKPEAFDVDVNRMKTKFMDGFIKNKEVIKKCLVKEDFNKVRACALHGKICIPMELWARIVYDYIIAFKKYEKKSSTILRSLVPIWFGRVYTFIEQTKDMNDKEAEKLIQEQARIFYEKRDYLLGRL